MTDLQNNFAFYSQRTEDTIMTGGGAPGQMSVKNQRLLDMQQKMSEFQNTLSEARKMYRDDYPPIKSLIAKIDNLQKQIDAVETSDGASAANTNTAPKPLTAVKVANPQVQQRLEELKGQINTVNASITMLNNDIQNRQAHIAELNKRIAEFQARIEAAPLNEQQYAQLNNDYQLAKQQYDLVTHRKEQSETQESMNEQQVGESLETARLGIASRELVRAQSRDVGGPWDCFGHDGRGDAGRSPGNEGYLAEEPEGRAGLHQPAGARAAFRCWKMRCWCAASAACSGWPGPAHLSSDPSP